MITEENSIQDSISAICSNLFTFLWLYPVEHNQLVRWVALSKHRNPCPPGLSILLFLLRMPCNAMQSPHWSIIWCRFWAKQHFSLSQPELGRRDESARPANESHEQKQLFLLVDVTPTCRACTEGFHNKARSAETLMKTPVDAPFNLHSSRSAPRFLFSLLLCLSSAYSKKNSHLPQAKNSSAQFPIPFSRCSKKLWLLSVTRGAICHPKVNNVENIEKRNQWTTVS